MSGGGKGVLTCVVWPAYIGLALEGETPTRSVDEPLNGGYQRGQILWYPTGGGEIVGRAQVLVPAGVYSHFVYFKQPAGGACCGVTKMPHPLRFVEPLTTLDVDPIVNTDLALSQMGSVHP